MKKIFASIFIFSSCTLFAQADSTSVSNTIADLQNALNILNNLPNWVYTTAVIFGATLACAQTILKLFPSEKSIKIGGILGKLADVLTFFIKENTTGNKNIK